MHKKLVAPVPLLWLLISCNNHSFRTDETDVSSTLVGQCFELAVEFHVFPRHSDMTERPDPRDTISPSFSYYGHLSAWPGKSRYDYGSLGFDLPAGSKFIVEKVAATHYPYPSEAVALQTYVRLGAEGNSVLIDASRVFTGPNGSLPKPSPYFLRECR